MRTEEFAKYNEKKYKRGRFKQLNESSSEQAKSEKERVQRKPHAKNEQSSSVEKLWFDKTRGE